MQVSSTHPPTYPTACVAQPPGSKRALMLVADGAATVLFTAAHDRSGDCTNGDDVHPSYQLDAMLRYHSHHQS